MRRHLGTLALSTVLALAAGSIAACGDAEGDPRDTTVAGTPSPTQETVDPLDADGVESVEVKLVRGTNGGGTVGDEAVPVTEDDQLEAFLADLDPAFAEKVRTRVRQLVLGPDQGVLAQVVAIGCESPTSATLRGNTIQADVPKSEVQCLAPVTTVALAVS